MKRAHMWPPEVLIFLTCNSVILAETKKKKRSYHSLHNSASDGMTVGESLTILLEKQLPLVSVKAVVL